MSSKLWVLGENIFSEDIEDNGTCIPSPENIAVAVQWEDVASVLGSVAET